MFTTPMPVFPAGLRLPSEQSLKVMNFMVGIAIIVCSLISLTIVTKRAEKTSEDFWGVAGTSFTLTSPLVAALDESCVLETKLEIGEYNVPYKITAVSRLMLMAHVAGLIKTSLFVSFTATLLSCMNKVLFNYNVHSFYGIRKGYLLMMELVFIVWAIVAVAHPQTLAKKLDEYIDICSRNPYGSDHLFSSEPHWRTSLFVGHGITLLAYFFNMLILFNNNARNFPNNLLLEWKEIESLLAGRSYRDPVFSEIADKMKREIEGNDTSIGIQHLLAEEYKLIDTIYPHEYEMDAPGYQ